MAAYLCNRLSLPLSLARIEWRRCARLLVTGALFCTLSRSSPTAASIALLMQTGARQVALSGIPFGAMPSTSNGGVLRPRVVRVQSGVSLAPSMQAPVHTPFLMSPTSAFIARSQFVIPFASTLPNAPAVANPVPRWAPTSRGESAPIAVLQVQSPTTASDKAYCMAPVPVYDYQRVAQMVALFPQSWRPGFQYQKRRRLPPSEVVRTFRCRYPGCPKAYGSGPALNLHIKKKHSGTATADVKLTAAPTTTMIDVSRYSSSN
ncbi:C2H2-type domain-containing protein [Plasmodiophora brassicae]|nr:hypothetical protein PBRA_001324 [Plasmodiophora brassicae]